MKGKRFSIELRKITSLFSSRGSSSAWKQKAERKKKNYEFRLSMTLTPLKFSAPWRSYLVLSSHNKGSIFSLLISTHF
jgi:hypothetical protein